MYTLLEFPEHPKISEVNVLFGVQMPRGLPEDFELTNGSTIEWGGR